MNQIVTATVNELWEHGIDASMLDAEIEDVIDSFGPEFDPERDWEVVAERLNLL